MKQRGASAAFTLLELLLAAAITAAMAAMMVAVVSGTLGLWRRTQDQVTTDAAAELILDYLERDLETVLFRSDGRPWLRCEGFDAALAAHGWLAAPVMKPAVNRLAADEVLGIGQARFGGSGLWLRFFTASEGVPVAVSYQLGRRAANGAPTPDPEGIRYSLFRDTEADEMTLATGYDVRNYDGAMIRPDAGRVVGTNVVDFGVWLYRPDGAGGWRRIFPRSDTDLSHEAVTLDEFPTRADVMIRVLTEEGAARLSALERGLARVPSSYAGREGEWWWSIAEAHSHVYVRRVIVRGGSG